MKPEARRLLEAMLRVCAEDEPSNPLTSVEEWKCANGASEVHVYFAEGGTGRSGDDYVFGFNPDRIPRKAVEAFLREHGFEVALGGG